MSTIDRIMIPVVFVLFAVATYGICKTIAKDEATRTACIPKCNPYPFIYRQGGQCVCDLTKVKK